MTDKQILKWIKTELGKTIVEAIEIKKPSPLITESVLAAIAFREVGHLLHKYVAAKTNFDAICSLMKGDYGKREGETEKSYHGFSFWQIDVNTDLPFIKTGEWKNPLKSCKKSIEILQAKMNVFKDKFNGDDLLRISIASYNCGEGNVKKAIKKGYSVSEFRDNKNETNITKDHFDIDYYTFNKDYSKEVLRFKGLYESIE